MGKGFVIISALVGLVAFVLSIVGICTTQWRTGDGGVEHTAIGLWTKCANGTCSDLYVGQNRAFFAFAHVIRFTGRAEGSGVFENVGNVHEIVRGFGIITVITAFAGVVFGILMATVKKFSIGYSVPATFFLMSGAFGIICASVFTSLDHRTTSGYGYSYGLTWAAAPIALCAGIMNVLPEIRSIV